MAFESGTVDSSPHRSQEIFSEKSVFVKSRMIFVPNLHAYAPKWDPFNFVLVETVEDVSSFSVLFHPMLYNCHPLLPDRTRKRLNQPSLPFPPNSRCPKKPSFWGFQQEGIFSVLLRPDYLAKGRQTWFLGGGGARARNRSLRAQKQTQYMPPSMESCKMGLLHVT